MFFKNASCRSLAALLELERLLSLNFQTQHISDLLGTHLPGYSADKIWAHVAVAVIARDTRKTVAAVNVHQGICLSAGVLFALFEITSTYFSRSDCESATPPCKALSKMGLNTSRGFLESDSADPVTGCLFFA